MCPVHMQGIPHNYFILLAVSWQPKTQSYIPMSDGLARYPSRKIANFPLILLGESHVLRELPLVSTNVRGGGTIQVPTLLPSSRFSAGNCRPMNFECLCRNRGISNRILHVWGIGAFRHDGRITAFRARAVRDIMLFLMALKTHRFALEI